MKLLKLDMILYTVYDSTFDTVSLWKLILWNGMLEYGILFKIYMECSLKHLIDKDLTKNNIEKHSRLIISVSKIEN